MKNNQPVTQREVPLVLGDRIISTTDLKGIITDVNDTFIRISGFTREELIGKPHNIVRHPDMPAAAFAGLWSNLRQGKDWMGLVKNRCKNGDHYYVDAHVTPIFEGSRVVGYQSVRVMAERRVIQRAEALYAELRKGGLSRFAKMHPNNWSYAAKAWAAVGLISLPASIAVFAGGSWIAALLTLIISGAVVQGLAWPVRQLARANSNQSIDALTRVVYTGRDDEIGHIQALLQANKALSRTIHGRVSFAATILSEVASEAGRIVEQATGCVRRQQLEVDQVATAMNEMAATVNEVARHAEETAQASQQVLTRTANGSGLVHEAIADIEALSRAVADATQVIERLQAESQSIGSVVEVISNIASQTNLLALNAAIEAARAGEQGRGFAVVADEVRNLASHTQKSTDEIQQMVKGIQQSSSAAVEVMKSGQQRASASVDLSRRMGQSFEEISAAVDRITNMNAQVATASEQQSAVTEEINRNLTGISDVANESLNYADQTAAASQRLHGLVDNLQTMLKQFSVD
ncbi:MAG TPA: PAS domain-containing methyl-accepting chemotaxis protein [Spongiibacteraceae bacterium]|nr:PAS domain-containing methyl-accepting chemotaxis protein [Spongiibacteraceae bacterium]